MSILFLQVHELCQLVAVRGARLTAAELNNSAAELKDSAPMSELCIESRIAFDQISFDSPQMGQLVAVPGARHRSREYVHLTQCADIQAVH